MFWIHSHQTGVENAVTRWRQKSKLVLVSLLLTGLLLAALLAAGYYLQTHRKNSKGVRLVRPEQVRLLSSCLLAFASWNIEVKHVQSAFPHSFYRPAGRDAVYLFYPLKFITCSSVCICGSTHEEGWVEKITGNSINQGFYKFWRHFNIEVRRLHGVYFLMQQKPRMQASAQFNSRQ